MRYDRKASPVGGAKLFLFFAFSYDTPFPQPVNLPVTVRDKLTAHDYANYTFFFFYNNLRVYESQYWLRLGPTSNLQFKCQCALSAL